mmetsp:Transcript_17398/g.22925  ORF Transcript_17398/g.22925 Transcript_17398/m.22925 type:complete len:184 (-) Transcript_17398:15-566(-)
MRIQKRYGPLNIYAGSAPPAKNKAQGYKKSKKKKKKKRTTPAASFIKAYPNATLHERANNLIQNVQNMDAPSRHKFYKNSLSQPADWEVRPKKYKPKVGLNKSNEILGTNAQYAHLIKLEKDLEEKVNDARATYENMVLMMTEGDNFSNFDEVLKIQFDNYEYYKNELDNVKQELEDNYSFTM